MKKMITLLSLLFLVSCKPTLQPSPDAGSLPGEFSGSIDGYRLTVQSASFFETFDPTFGYSTTLILSDDPAFCSRLRTTGGIDGGSTYAYFVLYREQNGAFLSVNAGNYNLDSTQGTGRFGAGYFAPTTNLCDSQIPEADSSTALGSLQISTVSYGPGGRLVGTFSTTFSGGAFVEGSFDAVLCDGIDFSNAGCV